jgi:hypothetical protein
MTTDVKTETQKNTSPQECAGCSNNITERWAVVCGSDDCPAVCIKNVTELNLQNHRPTFIPFFSDSETIISSHVNRLFLLHYHSTDTTNTVKCGCPAFTRLILTIKCNVTWCCSGPTGLCPVPQLSAFFILVLQLPAKCAESLLAQWIPPGWLLRL